MYMICKKSFLGISLVCLTACHRRHQHLNQCFGHVIFEAISGLPYKLDQVLADVHNSEACW